MDIQQKDFDELSHSAAWWDTTLQLSTWKLAPQADAAVTISMGENKLLVTAVLEKDADPNKDFTPLTIDRRDYFSAAWKIWWWSFRKREWRPSDNSILYARMTDRALRPLMPKNMTNWLVVTVTPLAIDRTQDLWVLSILWASTAILQAWIPMDWPIGAVRLWYAHWKILENPKASTLEELAINVLFAWPKWRINMIEAEWQEIPDEDFLKMCQPWQELIDQSIAIQEAFLAKQTISPKKITICDVPDTIVQKVDGELTDESMQRLLGYSKEDFNVVFAELMKHAQETVSADEWQDHDLHKLYVQKAVFAKVKNFIRTNALSSQKRIDNRWFEDVRSLYCEVWLSERVHWSWLFWRWDTQVLTTVTLGAPWEVEVLDTMEEDDEKRRYLHHYNFPWFSVNEPKPTRWPWRREVGHWALAEKALEPVLPTHDTFPYTIRAVSECLSSWGSTSQASVCWSTLALFDAWVPLNKPVAWIAMGLISDWESAQWFTNRAVLTDLSWVEDFTGDMDFKIAWTDVWITAIQLDTKVAGITYDIIEKTVYQAKYARLAILDFMVQTIPEPRASVNKYAPKIHSFSINPDKVRDVIWKWWETIDNIIEQCGGIKIDFEDDWTVFISWQNQSNIDKAVAMIKDIADDLPFNEKIQWKISRVEQYWFFVDLPKWKSWLVHVSVMTDEEEKNLQSSKYRVGDSIDVQITDIDNKWRLVIKLYRDK